MISVWKGIFGTRTIQNMTKIRCVIQENARYCNGKWDFTAAQEAVTRDVEFFFACKYMYVGNRLFYSCGLSSLAFE